jgi:hypothetical protein
MDDVKKVQAQWARLGIMFGVVPAAQTPDVEELLLLTAKAMPGYARFLPICVTWLVCHERLVARQRLAQMVAGIQAPDISATIGLLLDFARTHTGTAHFNAAIENCHVTNDPKPLFDVDRTSPAMACLAKAEACALSRRWGLWTDEPNLKMDAIRPARWVMANNPDLRYRAIFSGNLRASILACLNSDPRCGESESALARACGATRPALREALDHLELCGMVTRKSTGWRTVIEVSPNALVA